MPNNSNSRLLKHGFASKPQRCLRHFDIHPRGSKTTKIFHERVWADWKKKVKLKWIEQSINNEINTNRHFKCHISYMSIWSIEVTCEPVRESASSVLLLRLWAGACVDFLSIKWKLEKKFHKWQRETLKESSLFRDTFFATNGYLKIIWVSLLA